MEGDDSSLSLTEDRPDSLPDGIFSLLDTDLYKLTMQCLILKYFPDIRVTYALTNRTPDMRLTRAAYHWLEKQTAALGNIRLTEKEEDYLRRTCKYFSEPYLKYLKTFRFKPEQQVKLGFHPINDTGAEDDIGNISLTIDGLWLETILYEIPLLALISETYFKFIDRDWTYDGQVERAKKKGEQLCQSGCFFSEFGSRRRRDYHTHDLILRGLQQAQDEAEGQSSWPGKFTGTSNVHFAMKYGVPPVGTVAHEFFMAIASITGDYENANETALRYWISTFGEGVLGIALTDTFGTPSFLRAFAKQIPPVTTALPGAATTAASTGDTGVGGLANTKPPVSAPLEGDQEAQKQHTYAQVFTGVRQDSGEPAEFIKLMRNFYDSVGVKEKKTIVFSDALNVEKAEKLKKQTEASGLQPSFGIGTYFTNDYTRKSTGQKSVPMNIVIKLASAEGKPAIKISDNIGKNTGDASTVAEVKKRLGYTEHEWAGGDESTRWGKEGEQATKK